MLKSLLILLAVQAGAPDRLAPILERWRSGREEDRLAALREAASLRKELGDAALAKFAEPPLTQTWTHSEELTELVSRERIPAWSRLLIPLLKDREPRTAWQAAYALIQLEARDRVPDFVPLLKDADASVRPNVLHVLLKLGTREHAALVAPYLDDPEPDVASAAVQALGKFRARDYAPRIVKFLAATDPFHRQAAIASLAEMGAADKADKIAECLADGQELVRWEAVRALGRLKAREYAGEIVAMAEEDAAQAPVIEALGALGLRELAPHLLPFLDNPEPGIRWRAVRALGGVDAKDDAPRLAGMLKDEDSYVRLSALQSLAAMGSREQAAGMLALLHDEEFEVCKGATEETSAFLNADHVKTVVSLLGEDDPFVQWGALQLLVAAEAKSALPAVAARLRAGEVPNRDVVRALGRLGGPEQRERVAAALKSDDGLVRLQAAFAWARISDSPAELEAAEKTSKGAARLAAGFALVRQGRRDRAAAAALLREFVLHREEPDYPFLTDEIFDALAAGFEKEISAALSREVTAAKRIESARDLGALLSKAGVTLADGVPELRRRLPGGATRSARRALEWSFGGDTVLVPEQGKVSVMEIDRALEVWQKRLDAP
ncbi:MAG: HEAT repeat domain-containing protein [Planctomycetes bacterium]|nr:HEAT repeat domain-containing protein [Planctomycetota bacterium]